MKTATKPFDTNKIIGLLNNLPKKDKTIEVKNKYEIIVEYGLGVIAMHISIKIIP